MIASKSGLLVLALALHVAGIDAASVKKVPKIEAPKESAVLTTDEAQSVLKSIQKVMDEMRVYNERNRAPRPTAPRPIDPTYPITQTIDLSPILSALCSIQNKLCLILLELAQNTSVTEEILERVSFIEELIGDCGDESVLLPSQVDKEDIDSLCETVITLLKTILLELRGNFVTLP